MYIVFFLTLLGVDSAKFRLKMFGEEETVFFLNLCWLPSPSFPSVCFGWRLGMISCDLSHIACGRVTDGFAARRVRRHGLWPVLFGASLASSERGRGFAVLGMRRDVQGSNVRG